LYTQPKCTVKIASDKRCANFSLKIYQKRLAAGLRPHLLRELTALPQLDLRGKGKGRTGGKEDKGRRRHAGEREETGEKRGRIDREGRRRERGESRPHGHF